MKENSSSTFGMTGNTVRPTLISYGIAVLSVVITFALRLLLHPILDTDAPLLVFTVAVAVSALYGGLGPALLAIALSIVVGGYFFVEPVGSFLPTSTVEYVRNGIFVVISIFIIILSNERLNQLRLSRQGQIALEESRQQLMDSKEQVVNILESITDALYVLDRDWNFAYINPEAERTMLRSKEELLGKNIWGEFPAAAKSSFHTMYHRVMNEKVSVEFTEFYPEPLNRWYDVKAYPSKTGISVYFRDVTDQRQAQDALKKSETEFRAVFDNSLDVILIADDDGKYIDANPAACTLFSLTKEEITKYRIKDFLPAEFEKESERVWKLFLELGTQRGEYELTLPNGKSVEVEFAATAHILQGKHLSILRDITERKHTEEQLRKADQRAIREYEQLLERISRLSESLGTARVLKTIYLALNSFAHESTPCTGMFVSLFDVERQLRTPVFAFSEGEEADLSNLPPMPMNDAPQSKAVRNGQIIITDDFQAALQGQPVINIGMEENPTLPQSSLVAPMSIMGRVIGAVEVQSTKLAAFKRDHATALQMAANLTANAIENVRLFEQERLSAEQLRQSQKLESVGRLAGGIAHDFNNMLTAINGYSGMILRKLKSDDPIRTQVEEIQKAGERSAMLTQQLLAFSRQQILQPKVLDLNEVITDTNKMLHRLIGEDIELQLNLKSKLSPIKADPGQLTQVIMNIVINARDAMPQGGKIKIETDNVFLDEEFNKKHFPIEIGNYVMLAISDNGIGMDEQIKEQIFEPFFTTKEVGKGTGLGLATVYGIVNQSDGYIWAESQIGTGTTFRIILPLAVEENKQKNAITADHLYQKGTETILLVEDEPMVRMLIKQILEESGYQVLETSNGYEALEICEQSDCKIDLLMTDVVMPGMSGREVAEKLALIIPTMKVLFISGYTDDAIVRHGITETSINFIQKPFTFDTITQKVREVIDN